MTMAIGQLEQPKPQFVLKSFTLVKNAAGNLVVRASSVNYKRLPIVKNFVKNERVSARRRCDSGGMAGNSFRTCSYQIDVNGKAAWLSEKYIGKAERCEEVSRPMGQGSMTMLECYDENGEIKSSKMVDSSDNTISTKSLTDNSLADNKEKSNKTLYIIGAIALLGIGYYMYKKK